jgi:hypothetical protein
MNISELNLLVPFLNNLDHAASFSRSELHEFCIPKVLNVDADAFYMLVQHCVLLDEELRAAKSRVAELESQPRHIMDKTFSARLEAINLRRGAHPAPPHCYGKLNRRSVRPLPKLG